MSSRIEREPVGFASNVRLTLLALLALALALGWRPDVDAITGAIVGVGAAVEGWTTWWVRAAVTPEVVAKEREAAAAAAAADGAHAEGYQAAEDDVRKLDPAVLDPTPSRATRPGK